MIGTKETTDLSADERLRYRRHLRLPDVGLEGQRKLKQARVALIGAGGLGAPSALYLAAAGVGTIGIIDDDVVDASNLQRQVIHSTATVGKRKTESAALRIHELNPHVEVELRTERLTPATAVDFVSGYDIVVDGADNFPTRYAASDACVIAGRPYVYGAVYRFEGHVSLFDARTGPCYRCLFPEPPPAGLAPSCEDAGVLGVVPGIIGLLQATEAIKAIIGIGRPLIGRLLVYDALDASFRELRVGKDPACPACGASSTMRAPLGYDDQCGGAAESRSASVQQTPFDVQPQAVKERLDKGDAFELLDVRDEDEIEIAALPHTLHIPAHEVAERATEIPRDRDVVIFCHSGGRSSRVATMLRMQGFENVYNMNGGITRWSNEVDASVPRY